MLESFWKQALTGQDQLRQRCGLCAVADLRHLACRTATSATTRAPWPPGWTCWATKGFGNYRELLESVSRHPMMGVYLSHLRNQKADARTGRVPDENYAREVMQLFSIGLVELNADGSARSAAAASRWRPTRPADIAGLAKVFTGWSWACPDWPDNSCFFSGAANGNSRPRPQLQDACSATRSTTAPRRRRSSARPFAAQSHVRPAGQPERSRSTRWPRTRTSGPFIGRQLIQRLVTSNPSPALCGRGERGVQQRHGVRGDMKAVLKAVLMHPEARRVSDHRRQAARAGAQAVGLPARLRLHAPTPATGASATPTTPAPRSASRRCARLRCSTSTGPATCRPAPRRRRAALAVPELQIAHETTAAGYVNFMRDNIAQGVGQLGTARSLSRRDLQADFSAELALADQPRRWSTA